MPYAPLLRLILLALFTLPSLLLAQNTSLMFTVNGQPYKLDAGSIECGFQSGPDSYQFNSNGKNHLDVYIESPYGYLKFGVSGIVEGQNTYKIPGQGIVDLDTAPFGFTGEMSSITLDFYGDAYHDVLDEDPPIDLKDDEAMTYSTIFADKNKPVGQFVITEMTRERFDDPAIHFTAVDGYLLSGVLTGTLTLNPGTDHRDQVECSLVFKNLVVLDQ